MNGSHRAVLVAVTLGLLALGGCETGNDFWSSINPISGGREGGARANYDSLMRIGAAAHAGGDLPNAVAVFRRASELRPERPEPLTALGGSLLEMGSVDEAIVAYTGALSRSAEDPEALRGLARAYLRTGRPELAQAPLLKAYQQSPKDPKLLELMGVTADLTGKHQEAQGYYRAGLQIAPSDPALTSNLALSFAITGDYRGGIAVLEPVTRGPQASKRERQTLALLYGLQGNDAEAARLGRMDLDEASVSQNLRYYQSLRGLSPEARSRALLSTGAGA